ncbi:uncharacterized protein LOC128737756 [Sabethes cyaneus]|uniref:uncharacterized protein LOC128737756 n=1 Tax=Sabethes cyaneus TaxID=53552 RepID=UPI00237E59DD|nr:uncharacterized protein LOC128737756 [Sabethes cyaneus]
MEQTSKVWTIFINFLCTHLGQGIAHACQLSPKSVSKLNLFSSNSLQESGGGASTLSKINLASCPHPGLVTVKDDHDSDDFDDIKHAASSIVDGGVELEPNDRPILLDVLRKRTFSVEVHSLQRTLLSYKENKDCCQIYANDDCYSLLSSNRDLIKDAVSLGHCLWIK